MTKDKAEKKEHQEVDPSAAKVEEIVTEMNGSQAEDTETKEAVGKNSVESLQSELQESKEKYLRLSAEFDNYRKRTQREKMDLIKYGSEDVMKAMLPLVDDFERAVKHMEGATDIEALKQGIDLIYIKFIEFLKTNSVHEIEAFGLELDTDVHEAVTKTPAPTEELKGKIVDVVEKGYKLNDKVIRFSKVVIGE